MKTVASKKTTASWFWGGERRPRCNKDPLTSRSSQREWGGRVKFRLAASRPMPRITITYAFHQHRLPGNRHKLFQMGVRWIRSCYKGRLVWYLAEATVVDWNKFDLGSKDGIVFGKNVERCLNTILTTSHWRNGMDGQHICLRLCWQLPSPIEIWGQKA